MKFTTANGPISVNVATSHELETIVARKVTKKQSFALATLNLDHLAKMNSDPRFYKAYQDQDIVIADGNPLIWMARLAKQKLQLMPGSDLIEPLCRQLSDMGESVAFIGSTEDSLKKAEAHLTAKFPNLKVLAKISPPLGFDPEGEDAAKILSDIKDIDARVCFLAFGAPKQEILAQRGKQIAEHTGFVSIGAGLDFLAGTQERAPLWVRRIAMEWLWRLVLHPKRLAKRYAKCFVILPGHSLRSFAQRFKSDPPVNGRLQEQKR